MQTKSQVQFVELQEMHLIGFSITSSFKGHNPAAVDDMKQQFYCRKGEIKRAIHSDRYFCPSFSSEVLFTYLICMEVDSLTDIPEGMIGFTIPAHRYSKVKSKGDPYQTIHDYLNENGLQNDRRALALEMYHFNNPVWPDEAEVYIPLKAE